MGRWVAGLGVGALSLLVPLVSRPAGLLTTLFLRRTQCPAQVIWALVTNIKQYQAETAPRHIRGALISTYQLFITFGIFLAACFNYATDRHQKNSAASWRIPMGLGFVWPFILAIGIFFCPESPRWLMKHGKHPQAFKSMCRL